MESDEFGEALRRHRRAAGLTQRELAQRAGYSTGHISKLEGGARRPTRRVIDALANGLDLPPRERSRWERMADLDGTKPAIGARAGRPSFSTSFVGREPELRLLRQLLRASDVRLLTVRGPGGVGKTRLILRAAAEVDDDFRDGVFFISLSSLQDPAAVPAHVAHMLAVKDSSGSEGHGALVRYLAPRQALLILDTFEHLLPAASFVTDLLARCPALTIAVTSRSPLRVSGEQELSVEPLPVPALAERLDVAELAGVPSIALFVQRARSVDPSFAVTAESVGAVAAICRKLDGLPLAIELAAARIRMFSPPALLAALDDRFRILSDGPRDAPARHRSLWTTLDWSYHLLAPEERSLFTRLAVFAGGWTLPAVERVCLSDSTLSIPVVEGVSGLLKASLVQRQMDVDSEPRYQMLDTIRDFAFEHLKGTDLLFPLQQAHARFYTELAGDANVGLKTEEQEGWLRRLDADYLNIRTALAWALQYDLEAGIRMVTSLCQFWYMNGRLQEGCRWIDEALERATMDGNDLDISLHAQLMNSAGVLDWQTGEYGRARQLLAGAVTLRRTIGDRVGLSASLTNLGNVLCRLGNFEEGGKLFEESLELARALDDRWDIAAGLNNLGNVAKARGDDARALALYEESLALFREVGDAWNAAIALNNLGEIADRRGDWDGARQMLEESLAVFRDLDDPWSSAHVLSNLSRAVVHAGNFHRGKVLAEDGLQLFRQVGDTGQTSEALEALALALGGMGQMERMTRLLGAAAGIREKLGVPREAGLESDVARATAQARARLGPERFERAWAAGQAVTKDDDPVWDAVLSETP